MSRQAEYKRAGLDYSRQYGNGNCSGVALKMGAEGPPFRDKQGNGHRNEREQDFGGVERRRGRGEGGFGMDIPDSRQHHEAAEKRQSGFKESPRPSKGGIGEDNYCLGGRRQKT